MGENIQLGNIKTNNELYGLSTVLLLVAVVGNMKIANDLKLALAASLLWNKRPRLFN